MVFRIEEIDFNNDKICSQSYCDDKSKYKVKIQIKHSDVLNKQWWHVFSCNQCIGLLLVLPKYMNMKYFDGLPSSVISQLLIDVKFSRYTIRELEIFRELTNENHAISCNCEYCHCSTVDENTVWIKIRGSLCIDGHQVDCKFGCCVCLGHDCEESPCDELSELIEAKIKEMDL